MSNQYPGGIITKSPATPTGPYDTGTAPGIWTITQQAGYKQQGVWPTAGLSPNYIEDVFSTWLYTGTGASQTITNGIDLAGKGGLVWLKNRTGGSGPHNWYTTDIGSASYLDSSQTSGSATYQEALSTYNSNGFSLSSGAAGGNENTFTYASWTFRKQPKFFDVVTFSGNGGTQNIAHNLGSVPGCVIVKFTSGSAGVGNWPTWHRGLSSGNIINLNLTGGQGGPFPTYFGNNTITVDPTSTQFTVGSNANVNASGSNYVAYIFAHDAGGFGLTGTDNVISCGSSVGGSSAGDVTVTLGYEPQWVLLKRTNGTTGGDWELIDNMRGWPDSSAGENYLLANSSAAEATGGYWTGHPTATGFTHYAAASATYIYIAIRRGPMKVPTTGTSVFAPVTGNFTSPYTVTTNFPVDLTISSRTAGATRAVNDRLRGGTTNSYVYLNTATTAAESTGTGAGLGFQSNTAVIDTNWQTGGNALWWNFRRAPSFMDVVCYTGTGSATTFSHNLAAVPELIFTKRRDNGAFAGRVYHKDLGPNYWLYLFYNVGDAVQGPSSSVWNGTNPTASVFSVGTDGGTNASGSATVAYLFATCAGVSKVGSYTGTGATQTINCGFGAGGARFALIKRTDSTGDWWVWDSARGMVSGTDPRIDLNAGNSQTNANWVYTISTGFQIVTTDASVNASGGTYIFLAIA